MQMTTNAFEIAKKGWAAPQDGPILLILKIRIILSRHVYNILYKRLARQILWNKWMKKLLRVSGQ